MADCYYHGYSGAPGPCPQCQAEDAHGEERGKRGATLDRDEVMDLANINSIGRAAVAKMKREEAERNRKNG